VNDFDAALAFLQETALPVVRSQRGYKGLSASADRSAGTLGILSLWDSEADRDASESALSKTREEARGSFATGLTVENFEERAVEVRQPPSVGSALMVTRISMDPARVDENIEFFTREIAPRIRASAGFRALRNMIDGETGDGMVGTVWDDEQTMRAAAADAQARRADAVGRAVTFGDTSYREIVLTDLR
jgi:heme-degrading monooxygenase HmoA